MAQDKTPPASKGMGKRSAIRTTPITLGGDSPTESKSPDSGEGRQWLQPLKEFLAKLMAELDYDLDQDFTYALRSLFQRLQTADDTGQVLALGGELREVTARFARLLIIQKEDASSLVAEVVARLGQAEGHLRTSANQAREIHRAGANFSAVMQSQIQDLGTSVQADQGLEDLKAQVLARLDQFTVTVQDYQKTANSHLLSVSLELDQLRIRFQEAQVRLRHMEKENQDLAAKVRIDPLTGAYNRVALEERLAEEMARFQRYQRPFCLMLIDLDHFKRVNDSYGHQVGDICLREVVNRLKQRIRASDLLARYGGEEFVVVLPETQAEEARQVAEELRKGIAETEFTMRGQRLPLTVSIGLSQANDQDPSPAPLLSRADEALYAAKRGGRNMVVKG